MTIAAFTAFRRSSSPPDALSPSFRHLRMPPPISLPCHLPALPLSMIIDAL